MDVNGSVFRAGVNQNTVIPWLKKVAIAIPHAPQVSAIPEIAEIDELQTFVAKKNKLWLSTAVDHWKPGILAWVLGDRSSERFRPLWKILRGWQSFLYVRDGYKDLPCFLNDCDHLVLKTYTKSGLTTPFMMGRAGKDKLSVGNIIW
ncbi:MAG: IS1 family transposase [Moorea sp. SIO2B7]|nr:IS1 family transposase [Moorena sp. SIO2B7]